MSRSTQYIGLTKDAQDYLKRSIGKTQIVLCQGMFDEDIVGYSYLLPPETGPNKAYRAIETVQSTPWSSGPMIFTYLKFYLIRESGEEEYWMDAFQWVTNPTVKGEVDYERGHYFV